MREISVTAAGRYRQSQMWRTWAPLVGDIYCLQLIPVLRAYLRGYWLPWSLYVVVLVAVLVVPKNPLVEPLLAFWFVAGLCIGVYGQIRMNQLAQRIRKDLIANGVAVDRRAPVYSLRLFHKWQARNNIALDQIIAASQRNPADLSCTQRSS
jgi:hypothetical protein